MTTSKMVLALLLILLFPTIVGCREPRLTSTPSEVVVTSTAIAVPTPTQTLTANSRVTPSPTLAPGPVANSRWQCDPSGGVACFAGLGSVTMLNAEEGWAFGSEGAVFHYAVSPGDSTSTWQRVPSSTLPGYVHAFSLVSPTEGWGIQDSTILHYHEGIWEVVAPPMVAPFSDIVMVNKNEGWVVGDHGIILHYTEGEWQNTPGPITSLITAIDMVTEQEGWAVAGFGPLLHYQDRQWEQVELPIRYGVLMDIDMVNGQEGWAVGSTILHYHNGSWQEVTTEVAPH